MDNDDDFALALQLQEELNRSESAHSNPSDKWANSPSTSLPSSIVDHQWELIDPNPDARALFIEFNEKYFWGKLNSVEVKWSPRMTLCAGVCSYEGRGGLCSIRLSVPLLQLRPRKDLVETLLHEMIHAYLFVTDNNKDHDGHGPEFCKHMHRINKQTGSNITIYHTFHDEVDNYRQHWWKCDGPCQKRMPYLGVVKRAMNRAPSPRDPWWADHQRTCGGTFTKVKEPEGYGEKKSRKKQDNKQQATGGSSTGSKDIRDLFKKISATNATDTTKGKPEQDKDYTASGSQTGANINTLVTVNTSKKDEVISWTGGRLLGSTKTVPAAEGGPIVRHIPGIGQVHSERPASHTSGASAAGPANAEPTTSKSTPVCEEMDKQRKDCDSSGLKRKRPHWIESSDSDQENFSNASSHKDSGHMKKFVKKDDRFVTAITTGASVTVPGFKSVSNKSSSRRDNKESAILAAGRNQRAHYLSSDSESDTEANEQLTLRSVFKNKSQDIPPAKDSASPASSTVVEQASSVVSCPVCHLHVPQETINAHLDACLQ